MIVYLYKGVNEVGEITSGAKKMKTITDMKKYLEDRGIFEYEIYDTKTTYKEGRYSLVSPHDLSVFCKEISLLFSSNLRLIEGLYVITNAIKNKELKICLEEVCLYMDGGYSFSDAVSMYTHVFPEYMLSMISLGEATSSLNDVFVELSAYFEHENEFKQKIKNAVKYPTILIGMVSLLSLFLVTLVLPFFERAIITINADISRGFQIYKFFRIIIPVILILSFLLYVFLRIYRKTEKGRVFVDKLKITMPVVKNIYFKATLSKICKSLYILIRNGVYTSDALPQIINSIDNEFVKNEMISINQKVLEGADFIEAMSKSSIFSGEFTKKLMIGNATGQLDEMLLLLAKSFTNEVYTEIEIINKVYEPIIMAVVAVITGVVVISIILPIMHLLNAVSLPV